MIEVVTWKSQLQDLEATIDSSEKRLTGQRKQERDKRQIKAKLPQFNQQFDELDSALTMFSQAPHKYGLSSGEIESFISRINAARNKLRSITALCSKGDDNVKTALLGDSRARNVHDSEETVTMTNQQLYAEHQQRLASEDNQLDDISTGLTQLTDIANQQNQKLKYHETLLTNLDENVDYADHNMRQNIKRTEVVEVNSRGGWASMLVMIILFVLMGIIIITDWACAILPSTTRNC